VRNLLVILNPRRISECVDALSALNIDRLWLRYMTEQTIQNRWPEVLEAARGYDRIILVSDDTSPTQSALDAVQGLLDDGYPVVTGYCNLGANDERVNLCDRPLGPEPSAAAYHWLTRDQVEQGHRVVPTSFAGFALTGMSVPMWTQYPYRLHPNGNSADYDLCKRLERDRVPIVAARDGFVHHVKEVWAQPDRELRKRLLVGMEPASIDLEAAA
jgi:hypothetical protein